eukprot:TRINITY_DN3682_c0_g1_i1.p1 TRINITY_DN3682_c0_g1~~TRINITY_DN3682_c0_g1_i1.p1  ORF type:complete len:598 (+),score=154.87 TRINITY_DN3682_c0_g1_i1:60-1853(+)
MIHSALAQIDEVIFEYLNFRGFKSTTKSFEKDLKQDKAYGFDLNEIVKVIDKELTDLNDISTLASAISLLKKHTNGESFQKDAKDLLIELQKTFIVECLKKKKNKLVVEFFQSPSAIDDEWQSWYSIAFLQNPETNSHFSSYFKATWKREVVENAKQLLNEMAKHITLPKLVTIAFPEANERTLRCLINSLQLENISLSSQLDALKQSVERLEYELGSGVIEEPLEIPECLVEESQQSSSIPLPPEELSTIPNLNQLKSVSKKSILKCIYTSSIPDKCTVSKFSESGLFVADGGTSNALHVRRLEIGGSQCYCSPKERLLTASPITCLDWLTGDSDELLALGCADGTVKVMNSSRNVATCSLPTQLPPSSIQQLQAHSSTSMIVAVAQHKSSRSVTLAGWNADGKQCLWTHNAHGLKSAPALALDSTGRLLATGGDSQRLHLFDLRTPRPIRQAKISGEVKALHWLESGDIHMLTSTQLCQWGLRGNTPEFGYDVPKKLFTEAPYLLNTSHSASSCISFNVSNSHFMVSSPGYQSSIYSIHHRAPITTLPINNDDTDDHDYDHDHPQHFTHAHWHPFHSLIMATTNSSLSLFNFEIN